MNNEKYNQIIDETYKNYRSKSKDLDLPENLYNKLIDDLNKDAMFPIDNPSRMLSKEEFPPEKICTYDYPCYEQS